MVYPGRGAAAILPLHGMPPCPPHLLTVENKHLEPTSRRENGFSLAFAPAGIHPLNLPRCVAQMFFCHAFCKFDLMKCLMLTNMIAWNMVMIRFSGDGIKYSKPHKKNAFTVLWFQTLLLHHCNSQKMLGKVTVISV